MVIFESFVKIISLGMEMTLMTYFHLYQEEYQNLAHQEAALILQALDQEEDTDQGTHLEEVEVVSILEELNFNK